MLPVMFSALPLRARLMRYIYTNISIIAVYKLFKLRIPLKIMLFAKAGAFTVFEISRFYRKLKSVGSEVKTAISHVIANSRDSPMRALRIEEKVDVLRDSLLLIDAKLGCLAASEVQVISKMDHLHMHLNVLQECVQANRNARNAGMSGTHGTAMTEEAEGGDMGMPELETVD